MDPAEALDDTVTWWGREKFWVGYLLGVLTAIGVVALAG